MQDKWYGDHRFWKFSRVGMPLDPTRKLTSSAVKKISSQLLLELDISVIVGEEIFNGHMLRWRLIENRGSSIFW